MFEYQMSEIMFNHRKLTLLIGVAIAILVWLISIN